MACGDTVEVTLDKLTQRPTSLGTHIVHCVGTRRQEQDIGDNVQGIYRLHEHTKRNKTYPEYCASAPAALILRVYREH